MLERNDAETARIRMLNDTLRRTHTGGRVLITRGIAALHPTVVARILGAVIAFDAFTPDNDPHGEHDCALLDACGHRILWKIDTYDRDLAGASPDPADPAVTTRVLTVMLADEY